MARRKPPTGGDGPPPIPWAVLNAVPIEPELLIEALDGIVDDTQLPARKRPGEIESVFLTYCDFYDIDPDETPDEDALAGMMALAGRVQALAEAMERFDLSADPSRMWAVAEAACAARLIEKDGRPTFQPLDFLAALARAEQASA